MVFVSIEAIVASWLGRRSISVLLQIESFTTWLAITYNNNRHLREFLDWGGHAIVTCRLPSTVVLLVLISLKILVTANKGLAGG